MKIEVTDVLSVSDKRYVDEWIEQNQKLYYYYYLKVKMEKQGVANNTEEHEVNRRIYKTLSKIYAIKEALFGFARNESSPESAEYFLLEKMDLIMDYIYKKTGVAEYGIEWLNGLAYTGKELKSSNYSIYRIYAQIGEALDIILKNQDERTGAEPEHRPTQEEIKSINRVRYAIIEMMQSYGIITTEFGEVAKWNIATFDSDIENEIVKNNYNTHLSIEELLIEERLKRNKHFEFFTLNPILNTLLNPMLRVLSMREQIAASYSEYTEMQKCNNLTMFILELGNLDEREYQDYKFSYVSEAENGYLGETEKEVLGVVFAIADSVRSGKEKESGESVKMKAKTIEL